MTFVNDHDSPSSSQSSRLAWVFLGLGCLVPTIVCGGCLAMGGLGIFGVASLLKNSEPYKTSLAAAEANPAIQDALGAPLSGSFPQGNINLNNQEGEADLTYKLTGPNGQATIHVVGTRTNGQWTYSTMTATLQGETIELQPSAVMEE